MTRVFHTNLNIKLNSEISFPSIMSVLKRTGRVDKLSKLSKLTKTPHF